MTLIPASGKAELHLMYECSLACVNCNRLSVLRKPPTEPMTVEDAVEFFRQCRELDWKPMPVLIGGEPTMHPEFKEFVRLSREFAGDGMVQLWSNAYTTEARELCAWAERTHNVVVPASTHKLSGSVRHSVDDIFVSPVDFGKPQNRNCNWHASKWCGISVDHDGYTACAVGGAVDGFLGLGVRTKRLADLFDEKKALADMLKLCAHCGLSMSHAGPQWDSTLSPEEHAEWRAYVESQPKKYGSPMSPTWLKASTGRR